MRTEELQNSIIFVYMWPGIELKYVWNDILNHWKVYVENDHAEPGQLWRFYTTGSDMYSAANNLGAFLNECVMGR